MKSDFKMDSRGMLFNRNLINIPFYSLDGNTKLRSVSQYNSSFEKRGNALYRRLLSIKRINTSALLRDAILRLISVYVMVCYHDDSTSSIRFL